MTPILLRILACALLGAGATGWHAGSDALRLGQRVLTEVSATGPTAPPAVSGEADLTQVDPLTWRMVSLRMPDHSHPGSYLEVELLRPLGWINERKAAVGRWINFSVPELRISGMAEVTGIDACPPIESGYGRVVLGTFTSVSSDVYELKLAGQDEAIGVTYGHPIWSLDRGDWIAAGALRPGERLATAAGAAVVESVTAQRGERRVYNLSVEGDRRYLVGSVAVLAHNARPCTPTQLQAVKDAMTADPSDFGIGVLHEPTGNVYLTTMKQIPNQNGHAGFVEQLGLQQSECKGFQLFRASGRFVAVNNSHLNGTQGQPGSLQMPESLFGSILSQLKSMGL